MAQQHSGTSTPDPSPCGLAPRTAPRALRGHVLSSFRRGLRANFGRALMVATIGGAILPSGAAAQTSEATEASSAAERPTIGLVLAGGGAKGIAHVGVIKVLEEAGVQVDVIAGTSMGAIVGGLYAMGRSAEELEETVRSIDWENILVDDVPRPERSIRRKTDDIGFLAAPRLRLKNGQARLPQGAFKGQQLTVKLDRLMRAASGIDDFDRLPRRFRAVATDLETGEEVVLGSGSLAKAVRASMSFPGAFPPVELDGRVLIDGGVVNNVPVSVARDMGADIVIVSTFADQSVAARELTSVVSVLARTIDIMLQDSRTAQIASLSGDDVLIVIDLDDIGTSSFERAPETIEPGETAAREHFQRLADLGKSKARRPEALVADLRARRIRSISIETDTPLSEEVLRARMRTREGDAFDPGKIEEDLKRIYGLELFETVTYDVEPVEDEVALRVVAKEDPAGKDYLRFGVHLQTDLGRETSYDVAVSYTVPAINELNGEWRSTAIFGERIGASTELYQPLDYGNSFFVMPEGVVLDRDVNVFENRRKVAEARVLEARARLNVGYNFNDDLAVFGQISRGFGRVREVTGTDRVSEGGFDTASLGVLMTYDTVDSLEFPRNGALVQARYAWSPEALGADEEFHTAGFSANIADSIDRHSFILSQFASFTLDGELDTANLFELGGPFRLSGLLRNALSGDQALLSRAIYLYELDRFGPSFLDVPLYAGASLEYGNVFDDTEDIEFADMLAGGSVFLGADTFLGPLYLGYGLTEGGEQSVYLLVGGIF